MGLFILTSKYNISFFKCVKLISRRRLGGRGKVGMDLRLCSPERRGGPGNPRPCNLWENREN